MNNWKMKFDYTVQIIEHEMTIEDAANFAAILNGKKINEILPGFKTHWNTLNLVDFDLKRSIKRVELAAILNEYDVFNQFNVDVFGFYIK
jgi:molybdenum cofactor biosynthesis enzyme